MPRKPRVSIPGVVEHVIQRGNNRQIIFTGEDDMGAYLTRLKGYAEQYDVKIHAWVLMTNHVHLLCTPSTTTAISKMMQSLGRMYVMYFNRKYHRTGTLWEGRYKSCLVQDERYLLHVYRYIELNPVRAEMVDDPGDYGWSSYLCNGLGQHNSLLTPHPLYLALGLADEVRQQRYRSLFSQHVDGALLDDIRKATNKGLALGNDRFIDEIAAITGVRLVENKRGRKVGWRKVLNTQHH